jgi:hypothetical protein
MFAGLLPIADLRFGARGQSAAFNIEIDHRAQFNAAAFVVINAAPVQGVETADSKREHERNGRRNWMPAFRLALRIGSSFSLDGHGWPP